MTKAIGTWDWANRIGNTGSDSGNAITTLSDKSSLVTGFFQGTITFGLHSLTSTGASDIFIARISSSGQWLWATKAGGTLGDSSVSIKALPDDSALITGNFRLTATFGDYSVTSSGGPDIFVAKINSSGIFQWVTSAGGAGNSYSIDLTILSDNSALITGIFDNTITFGSDTLTSSGNNDIFVAKINSSGVWQWASRAGYADQDDQPYAIVALSDDSAIVTGLFSLSCTFGVYTITGAASTTIFVAKINSSGVWQWAVAVDSTTGFNQATNLAKTSNDNVLITGFFSGIATFGTHVIEGSESNDIFVAKINSSGVFQWATQAGDTTGNNQGNSIAVLPDDSALIFGSFANSAIFNNDTIIADGSDIFIAKINSSGEWIWAKNANELNIAVYAQNITLIDDGYALVTGYFQNTAIFGTHSLTSAGNIDIFVSKVFIGYINDPYLLTNHVKVVLNYLETKRLELELLTNRHNFNKPRNNYSKMSY